MMQYLSGLQDSRPLVFFGVGASIQNCYRQLVLAIGRQPDFLCDNDPGKQGRAFFGIPCISPAELGRLGHGTAIVITIRKYENVYRQLIALGFQNVCVACFDRGYDIVGNIQKLCPDPPEVGHKELVNVVRGKWTLITGASRGIGRQIALAMAELGAHVILHSRQTAHTSEVADACSALGVQVLSVAGELDNHAEPDRMLDTLATDFPPVDIVFNNAAISLPCGSDPWNVSSRDYMTHYAVNAVAPIQICCRLIPRMMQRGFGRIVNISSTIQKRPGEMAYACSKAALDKFVHDLAPGLAGTGVMISLVCPGYVRSDMGGPDAPHPLVSVIPGVLLGAVLDQNVNGRWIMAQDYAGMDLFAAARRAKFYCSLPED